ncbi:MAG: hypothetical protein P9L94_18380 [Candidatus Hinthialibacter antarcticus]|nr:hypothetical protein [Candidatus Hinthialibacter antarcticus]
MKRSKYSKTLWAISLIALLALPAWACRFNVRDVGFVDFGQTPYQLFIVYNQSTAKEQQDALEQIGFAALLESNVQIEMVDLDQSPDHEVKRFLNELKVDSRPAAVLVSPDGKALNLPIPTESAPFRDAVWDLMESIVSNEFREEILDASVQRYGVVLLIEGKDDALNKAAITAAKEAVDDVASRMDSLPKEIKQPPVLKQLAYEDAKNQPVLLWALGVKPDDLNQPHAAILYGRGRCLGDVLYGDAITKSSVGEILSVIGLSCECGLDREWMMGRQFPLRWDTDRQDHVIKNLGFDAESPLVKTEISQIMAIGQRNADAGSGTSRNVSLNPIMGYSEMIVEAAPVEPPDAPRVVEEDSNIGAEQQLIAANNATQELDESVMAANTTVQTPIETETTYYTLGIGFYFLLIAASISLIAGVSIIIWARSKNV